MKKQKVLEEFNIQVGNLYRSRHLVIIETPHPPCKGQRKENRAERS